MATPASVPGSPWAVLAGSWEDLFPLRQPRLDLALALSAPGGRTLDAGCATGSLVRALARHGRRAEGLDLEPAFLEVARARSAEAGLTLPWHQASLLDLGRLAGQGSFALVTCLGQTLPHLLTEVEWLDFFGQARDLLEPGGRLVIQVVNDGAATIGSHRDLPPLMVAAGTLERRRTMLSETLAQFETAFRPAGGEPVASIVRHLRMGPERAAELLHQAGLEPEPPLADESGRPFEPAASSWLLVAARTGQTAQDGL
jgi:2-polyprenyl-3-methyl-5-hydroxy-6-metoxy-1,4-benzoquinol methylase